MDRDGGRGMCRTNKPRDNNKIDVPRDEEGGADVGLDLPCEKEAVLKSVMLR